MSGWTEPGDEAVAAFWRDGVTVLRALVDPSWLARLEAAVERDMRTPGPFFHGYDAPSGGRFHGNLRLWEHDADFRSFCFESTLPRAARLLMGSRKVNLLYDQLFVKEARTANATRWHNDQPYWAVRGRDVLSIWVALDPTTAASGALEFVAGSHRWDRWFQPEAFGPNPATNEYERNPDYEPMIDVEGNRAGHRLLGWDLAPGDALAFHGLTVHGAPGNTTTHLRRRGYAVRYTGDDAVYDTRPGTNRHLRNEALRDGAPLDSERFPVVLSS